MVCYIASYLYHVLLTVTLDVVLLSVSVGESYSQLDITYVAESCTVEPMCYGYIRTIHKCPDYQGVLITQFSLHAKAHL